MATRTTHRFRFRVSPDDLNARFADPAYYAWINEIVGCWDVVEQPPPTPRAGNSDELHVCYAMKIQASIPLPETLKKLLGGALTLKRTDRWNAADRAGSIDVAIKGLPVRIGATTRLEPAGNEVEVVSDWILKCDIPLIGGIVERLGCQEIEKRLMLECAAVR